MDGEVQEKEKKYEICYQETKRGREVCRFRGGTSLAGCGDDAVRLVLCRIVILSYHT